MRHTEILLDKDQQLKQNHLIPKPLVIVGAFLLVLNALYLGIWGFSILGEVFAISTSVGLIMLFTAVGFIPFAPLWLGIASLTWFDRIPRHVSKGEYWSRVSLCFLAGMLAPYLLYTFTTFATLIIAASISTYV